MRYAIFSDIHANREAWERVLDDIRSLEADVLVCLGDVVGYGPLPEEVLTGIRQVTDNFVLGNHDAAAVGILDAALFNEHARGVIEWTSEQLSEDSRAFLSEIPLAIEAGDILFVHAEVNEPERFGYIVNVEDAFENFASGDHFLTFVGHTHNPTIFELGETGSIRQLPDENCQLNPDCRYIVNVGSVGEPRNPDDIRARYVIYDDETREVYFRKVEFDPEIYRRDLHGTSLELMPYFLAVVDGIAERPEEPAMVDMEEWTPSEELVRRFSGTAQSRGLHVPGKPASGPVRKPKPATRNGSMGPHATFLALFGGLAVVAGGLWLILHLRGPEAGVSATQAGIISAGTEQERPLPPAVEVVNGSFEQPEIRGRAPIAPLGWARLGNGRQELANTAGSDNFTGFEVAGKQVVTIREGAGIYQRVGLIVPGLRVRVSLRQFRPKNGGEPGGLAVQIWQGDPRKGGTQLAEKLFKEPSPGKQAGRKTVLACGGEAETGRELYLLLRHEAEDGSSGDVVIDDVRLEIVSAVDS